ncbi:hypothetical protein FOL47_007687 [Perkinsus chesapeaki]|uniref:Uncharacterized protein n=1 Tax=Perkinsus chesapeaki TaxID=330153 RepID=A0A7J6LJL3_PERCH|nr:hypothetical protein FOL47_007687 [Perkinsus chesapeaki]
MLSKLLVTISAIVGIDGIVMGPNFDFNLLQQARKTKGPLPGNEMSFAELEAQDTTHNRRRVKCPEKISYLQSKGPGEDNEAQFKAEVEEEEHGEERRKQCEHNSRYGILISAKVDLSVFIALWLCFFITANAEKEFPKNSVTAGGDKSHKQKGHHHHHHHGKSKENKKKSKAKKSHRKIHDEGTSILEQGASRRRLRQAQEEEEVPKKFAPLPSDTDALFNDKYDVLDTNVFLNDPDLQPLYAQQPAVNAKPQVKEAPKSLVKLSDVPEVQTGHLGVLHRLLHAAIGAFGISLVVLGALIAVHTDYRRRILDGVRSGGEKAGPKVKEAFLASWCKIGNYVNHGRLGKGSADIPIIDPVLGPAVEISGGAVVLVLHWKLSIMSKVLMDAVSALSSLEEPFVISIIASDNSNYISVSNSHHAEQRKPRGAARIDRRRAARDSSRDSRESSRHSLAKEENEDHKEEIIPKKADRRAVGNKVNQRVPWVQRRFDEKDASSSPQHTAALKEVTNALKQYQDRILTFLERNPINLLLLSLYFAAGLKGEVKPTRDKKSHSVGEDDSKPGDAPDVSESTTPAPKSHHGPRAAKGNVADRIPRERKRFDETNENVTGLVSGAIPESAKVQAVEVNENEGSVVKIDDGTKSTGENPKRVGLPSEESLNRKGNDNVGRVSVRGNAMARPMPWVRRRFEEKEEEGESSSNSTDNSDTLSWDLPKLDEDDESDKKDKEGDSSSSKNGDKTTHDKPPKGLKVPTSAGKKDSAVKGNNIDRRTPWVPRKFDEEDAESTSNSTDKFDTLLWDLPKLDEGDENTKEAAAAVPENEVSSEESKKSFSAVTQPDRRYKATKYNNQPLAHPVGNNINRFTPWLRRRFDETKGGDDDEKEEEPSPAAEETEGESSGSLSSDLKDERPRSTRAKTAAVENTVRRRTWKRFDKSDEEEASKEGGSIGSRIVGFAKKAMELFKRIF